MSVLLVPQWAFTHVYPLSEPKRLADAREEVNWTVSIRPDGSLVELASGLELSYLFWEAAARAADAPPTPPLPPVGDDGETVSGEYFDPSRPYLEPGTPTAVLLPFAALLPYLDNVLRTLALHTAARNDFITYWLPALSKRPYVALRFLPQAAYERAAELRVEPKPDVVTRVMMLFRGVAEEDVGAWAVARERASAGSVDWASVVGVKAEALEEEIFRVLEWGAAEVL